MSNNKANIYVVHGDSGVYLYTNKDGDILPRILQAALIRGKERWGDTATLTRIIFSEMVQRDVFGTNSHAITPNLIDNENMILVVNDVLGKVGVFGPSGTKYKEFTFDKFTEMNISTWRDVTSVEFSEDRGINRRKKNPYIF